jgi:hypothetical protein
MKLSVFKNVHLVEPGDFEPSDHWYPRVLNSNIHPLVAYFLNLSHDQIIERYIRINPSANKESLKEILSYQPKFFRWAGSDLMHVSDSSGHRHLTLIETNSCPSGQKSMPLMDQNIEQGGYKRLIEQTFQPMVNAHTAEGALAVIYDKNPMENIGYAATIADCFRENVYLVQFNNKDSDPSIITKDDQFHVKVSDKETVPIRAAFRYVTQEPWNRLPLYTKTLLLNPIQACLAGGRNKEKAFYAYEEFNSLHKDHGLKIQYPRTYPNISYSEIESYYEKLNGNLVIKLPDSNAGQGVYTITSQKELKQTLTILANDPERKYLLQELIFSNMQINVKNMHHYHIGTLPDLKNRIFAFDVRMMIHATSKGLRPLAGYSRISRYPLNQPLPENLNSWDLYGTNLSVKSDQGWEYDDARLMIFDIRNFGRLGLGVDEMIQGFIQTCMAVYAIDNQAQKMYNTKEETNL